MCGWCFNGCGWCFDGCAWCFDVCAWCVQIAALAIRSGNGVVLKGGKEAVRTNGLLHSIVTAAIHGK